MELRPVQTALFAGRAASRWASSTKPSSSSRSAPIFLCPSALHRHFSTTRPLLQEAEAPAPPPTAMPSMVDYVKQQVQQQSQTTQPSTQPVASRSIFASPGASKSPGGNSYVGPWTERNRPNAVVPQSNNVLSDLGMEGWFPSRPDAADLTGDDNARAFGGERPIDVKYRLRPVIGRTITLQGNVDVARALNLLNMKVSSNKVKADANKQRFHERPGLKRKRLRRERWRARFKQGFKATCSRVRELAKQGW